jgi:ribonuclease BN (tRNA processing enzyme)
MQLKILGTGTSQVSKERVSTSNYIEIGNKKTLLDCGCGALVRMSQAEISFKDIDIVFISHFHIDHISDLFALLWALKYSHLNRDRDLQIIGPKGFQKFYNTYVKPIVFSKPFDLFRIEIREIEDEIKFDDFTVQVLSTSHTDESLAYKFIENEKTLVIGGDTGYDENIIDFSKESDILILECSYDNSKELENHLTPKECGHIAKMANVKKLIITHFYPISKEVRLEETKEIFENTLMAEDLMNIDL